MRLTMTSLSSDGRLHEARRRRFEAMAAVRRAERVDDALVDRGLRRLAERDAHPADRVDPLDDLRLLRRAEMAPRDELGEDRDRDLGLARGAEVEAGGAADARDGCLVHAAGAESVEDDAGAPRARDEADVARASLERGLESVLASSRSVRAAGPSPSTTSSGTGSCGSTRTSTVPSDAHMLVATTTSSDASSAAPAGPMRTSRGLPSASAC